MANWRENPQTTLKTNVQSAARHQSNQNSFVNRAHHAKTGAKTV
jgi:hypothetical protein